MLFIVTVYSEFNSMQEKCQVTLTTQCITHSEDNGLRDKHFLLFFPLFCSSHIYFIRCILRGLRGGRIAVLSDTQTQDKTPDLHWCM